MYQFNWQSLITYIYAIKYKTALKFAFELTLVLCSVFGAVFCAQISNLDAVYNLRDEFEKLFRKKLEKKKRDEWLKQFYREENRMLKWRKKQGKSSLKGVVKRATFFGHGQYKQC